MYAYSQPWLIDIQYVRFRIGFFAICAETFVENFSVTVFYATGFQMFREKRNRTGRTK